MNPIVFALRHPYTVMVAVLSIVLGSAMAVSRMKIDIFPSLNLPVIYVAQPYGGMDPAQMEGLLTNYYEYHFLYIAGIHHVESKNIQGVALMKLYFQPGTDIGGAIAQISAPGPILGRTAAGALVATALASGNLSHRTTVRTGDEVGGLAVALNHMAAVLEQRQDELAHPYDLDIEDNHRQQC